MSEEQNQELKQEDRSESSSKTSASTQIAIIIGSAALLVVALFLVSTISKQALSPTSPIDTEITLDGPQADVSVVERHAQLPLSENIAPQADSLEAVIDATEGEERREAQRQLVDLLLGVGRVDRASIVQHKLAEENDTPEAWRRAGDLYYEWMSSIDGVHAVEVAELAVASYRQVLQHEPNNLDVRADMATAYLETNDPMRGVDEIQRVLQEDPNHLQARFNYGIMLTMIGRTDDAVEQFEAVKDIVGEGSPYYRQAEQVIAAIMEEGL